MISKSQRSDIEDLLIFSETHALSAIKRADLYSTILNILSGKQKETKNEK